MMVPIKLIIVRFVLDNQVLTLSLSPYIYSTPEKVSFAFFSRLYLGLLSIACSSFLIYLNHNLKYNVLKLGFIFEIILNLTLIYFIIFGIQSSSSLVSKHYGVADMNCYFDQDQSQTFAWFFHLAVLGLFQSSVLCAVLILIKLLEYFEAIKQNIQIITQEDEVFVRQSSRSSRTSPRIKKSKSTKVCEKAKNKEVDGGKEKKIEGNDVKSPNPVPPNAEPAKPAADSKPSGKNLSQTAESKSDLSDPNKKNPSSKAVAKSNLAGLNNNEKIRVENLEDSHVVVKNRSSEENSSEESSSSGASGSNNSSESEEESSEDSNSEEEDSESSGSESEDSSSSSEENSSSQEISSGKSN